MTGREMFLVSVAIVMTMLAFAGAVSESRSAVQSRHQERDISSLHKELAECRTDLDRAAVAHAQALRPYDELVDRLLAGRVVVVELPLDGTRGGER
jgi:hypothetical protein